MDNKPVLVKHFSEGMEKGSPCSCVWLQFAGQWSTHSTDEVAVRLKSTWDLSKRFLTDPWSQNCTAGGMKLIFHQDSTILHRAVKLDPARDMEQKWEWKKILRLSPGDKKLKTSDFEGCSPEEEKQPDLQMAAVRKENVPQRTYLPQLSG